jgi:DNA-binding MarR family transcriptional regulator
MNLKNTEIINKLFRVKSLILKAGKKNIFGQKEFTVGFYELLKVIETGNDKVELMKEHLSDSAPALSQKIKKLEKLNYLREDQCENCQRVKKFKLTPEGQKVLKKVDRKINLVSSIIFIKYSKEEKEVFYKILNDFESLLNKKLKEK